MKSVKIKLKHLKTILDNGLDPYIKSPTGLTKITNEYKKYSAGVNLTFSDSTQIKCAVNHRIWNGFDFIESTDIRIGDIIDNRIVTNKSLVDYQQWIDFGVEAAHQSYTHNGFIHHNSGKSAVIYVCIRWILEQDPDSRVILIVPNVQLVNQMMADFKEYSMQNGFDVDHVCQRLYGGQSKDLIKRCLITTWQSFTKLTKSKDALNFMKLYRGVIVDECHQSAAKELQSILSRCTNAQYRIGTSGTVDQSSAAKVNLLQIEGYLGPVHKVITTKQLMDAGQVSQLKIKALVLKHLPDDCKAMKKIEYADEIAWLVSHAARNEFLCKVALAAQQSNGGATLLLVRNRETHAKPLYEKIKAMANCPVYYISGEVSGEQREIIRNLANVGTCIIVATLATMAVGVNIPNIRSIIFGSPSKSMITVLQSIGRALRLHSEKDCANVYDIIDDLRYKKRDNYAYTHGVERLTIYRKERFDINVKEIALQSTT